MKTEEQQNDSLLVTITVADLRAIISEEISAAIQSGGRTLVDKDKMLTPDQAAEILKQNVRWLYRHAPQLPFTRRLSRKSLRFSEAGLHRWLTAKTPGLRR